MMFVVCNDYGCTVSIETDEERARDYADHLYGYYYELGPGEGKFEWYHGDRKSNRLDNFRDELGISTWSHRGLFNNYNVDEEFLVRDDGSTYAWALTQARVKEILTNGSL